jgi:hypothetical protein
VPHRNVTRQQQAEVLTSGNGAQWPTSVSTVGPTQVDKLNQFSKNPRLGNFNEQVWSVLSERGHRVVGGGTVTEQRFGRLGLNPDEDFSFLWSNCVLALLVLARSAPS